MPTSMITESEFRRMAHAILTAAKADHTFVSLDDSEAATLRFANNQVVQNVALRGPSVSIRVAFGSKTGGASTNRLDAATLIATLRQAEAIARLAPDDPEYLPPLPPQQYAALDSWRPSTANASAMDLARSVAPVIADCEKHALVGAGIMTNGANVSGIAASSGLFGYERATDASFSLTATAEDSSGWTFNRHRDINHLEVPARSGRAVDKALRSRAPRELPAGHYPVILEPAAVAGIFGPFFFGIDAKSYYRGNSAFVGKLDTRILDERLTLRTDPAHPDLLGSAFDGQGLPNRPQTLVENGVLKQLSYDRFTAKEHNVEPTPRPSAPIMSLAGPNAQSLDDLVASTDRAILITNFWYIRSVDPADLTITGMTRDGTFLIEKGEIVCGVRNFRFHDSPLRCFQTVDAATAPMESITMERGKMLLPAVRLPDFHLSSVTKF